MIDLTDYVSVWEDLEPGETARVNHDHCTAGQDTRRRLYITRVLTDPAKIICYCHNCADDGLWNTVKHTRYRGASHKGNAIHQPVSSTDVLRAPRTLIYEPEDWPIDATAWRLQNNLSHMECIKYNIGYDPSTDRVYLPRFNVFPTGHLKGYQLRKLNGARRAPKYLTVTADDDPGYTKLYAKDCDVAVVVEDLVSGIHIIEAFKDESLKVGVFVNYGTKVQVELLHEAAEAKSHVVVWLDNDNPHVKAQAHKMGRVLHLLGANVKVEGDLDDPKRQAQIDIRHVVGK